MRSSIRSRHRKGQSLILILFVLIALIGLMALTLDFGFVLLARRQMQTGVNAAAIEGNRFQDRYPPLSTLVPLLDDPASCTDLNDQEAVLECLRDEAECESSDDACLRDYIQRKAARHLMRVNFDDDFALSSNETTIGAGIDSSLIQGHRYREVTIGPPGSTLKEVLDDRHKYIYRPDDFELNLDNLMHGDMVTGGFEENASHAEHASYFRNDFDPNGTGAFLIRMRQTHNANGLDGQDGVSSRGGGLPLMLARAGWMRAEDDTADYSVRRDGVAVRATAIVHGTPALAVGKANPAHGLRGLANFVLTTEFWASEDWEPSGTDGEESIDVEFSGMKIEYSGDTVGYPIDSTRSNVSVGECVSELGTSSGMVSGFAPLSAPVRCLGSEMTDERVVAFGDIVSVTQGADDTYTLIRRPSSVGTHNVSATFLRTAHLADPSYPVDVDHLMEQRGAVTSVMLAPALARSVR